MRKFMKKYATWDIKEGCEGDLIHALEGRDIRKSRGRLGGVFYRDRSGDCRVSVRETFSLTEGGRAAPTRVVMRSRHFHLAKVTDEAITLFAEGQGCGYDCRRNPALAESLGVNPV